MKRVILTLSVFGLLFISCSPKMERVYVEELGISIEMPNNVENSTKDDGTIFYTNGKGVGITMYKFDPINHSCYENELYKDTILISGLKCKYSESKELQLVNCWVGTETPCEYHISIMGSGTSKKLAFQIIESFKIGR